MRGVAVRVAEERAAEERVAARVAAARVAARAAAAAVLVAMEQATEVTGEAIGAEEVTVGRVVVEVLARFVVHNRCSRRPGCISCTRLPARRHRSPRPTCTRSGTCRCTRWWLWMAVGAVVEDTEMGLSKCTVGTPRRRSCTSCCMTRHNCAQSSRCIHAARPRTYRRERWRLGQS